MSTVGPERRSEDHPTPRAVLRVVAIVVLSILALYLIYLLRTPISYVVLAAFVAACASGPVNALGRYIGRGGAIAVVYLLIVLVPLGILVVLIRPLIRQTVDVVNNLPEYVRDLESEFAGNDTLKKLNEEYDLTDKLEQEAAKLAANLDDAALAIADVGVGLVGSVFALVTVLVLSIFMVARGRSWVEAALAHRPAHQARAIRTALDKMGGAVGGYVGGALLQATVAGIAAFVMLVILGVPSPLPLALLIAILDLIPLVGATLGAVIVGVVILFSGSIGDVIAWAVFAIAYQQFENYVVQPRIQSRAVSLDPFVVVIAALFGGALLGIVGALLAIPPRPRFRWPSGSTWSSAARRGTGRGWAAPS